MFFKKEEKLITLPCSKAEWLTKGVDGQIDSVFIEFGLTLFLVEELKEHFDYFSEIDIPERKENFVTRIRFRLQANELVCKQLSEDYAKNPNKNPVDILLHQENPDVPPYYRKMINYKILKWKVVHIPY